MSRALDLRLVLLSLWVYSSAIFAGCDDDPKDDKINIGEVAGEQSSGEQAGEQSSDEQAGELSGGAQSPWVTIGTGFRRYEVLTEGQEVPIIAGIQGGFHVWGGFVGTGFDDADVRVVYTLELNGEAVASADYTEFELPQNSRGEFEYAGVSVIYFRNEDVEPTSGQEMNLKLEVITRDGLRLRDESHLVPICCE